MGVKQNGTFDTIRMLVENGNLDQQNVDLLMLGGMIDIKDELNEMRHDMTKNFVRKDTDEERAIKEREKKEQEEINKKVGQMWNWHSALKWLVIVGVPMLMTLLLSVWWGLITNKIAITVVP